VPGVALSSDFICGFCGETDEEFEDTISLIKHVKYNMAYLFPYSLREVCMFMTQRFSKCYFNFSIIS
jgi:tRNA A37 methylthiotransferase MiaB